MIRHGIAKSRPAIGNIKHLAVATDDHAATEILQELIDELTRSLGKRETQCVACRVQSSELAAIHALEQSGFLLMEHCWILSSIFPGSQPQRPTFRSGIDD
jgi:hypothetical protein